MTYPKAKGKKKNAKNNATPMAQGIVLYFLMGKGSSP